MTQVIPLWNNGLLFLFPQEEKTNNGRRNDRITCFWQSWFHFFFLFLALSLLSISVASDIFLSELYVAKLFFFSTSLHVTLHNVKQSQNVCFLLLLFLSEYKCLFPAKAAILICRECHWVHGNQTTTYTSPFRKKKHKRMRIGKFF